MCEGKIRLYVTSKVECVICNWEQTLENGLERCGEQKTEVETLLYIVEWSTSTLLGIALINNYSVFDSPSILILCWAYSPDCRETVLSNNPVAKRE